MNSYNSSNSTNTYDLLINDFNNKKNNNSLFTYEHHTQKIATNCLLSLRLLLNFVIVLLIIIISTIIGMLGYHYFEELSWFDSFYAAGMDVSNMGPVVIVTQDSAKIFSIFYCNFCALLLITNIGFLLSPIYHRILHNFHVTLD